MVTELESVERKDEDEGPDPEEHPEPSIKSAERPISHLEIDVKEDHFPVSVMVRRIQSGQLVLAADFQRKGKEGWPPEQRSRFIESILLNYPLPPLYLNQDRAGRYMVVDGLQRSTSVFYFLGSQFALQGLERLSWLNGSRFSELGPALRARIEDRKLLCYVLRPSVPLSVVVDIFARINQGGTELSRQEIRHALHRGKSTDLLGRLTETPAFGSWIGRRLRPDRMGDEEAALRCIAFMRMDPEKDYRGDMDKFLESMMLQINDGVTDAWIDSLVRTFEGVFDLSRDVLGKDAFRIPTENGMGRINIAVMESVCRFFAEHSEDWIRKNASRIEMNYKRLIADQQYRDAVRSSTGDPRRVRTRFQMAREILGEGCAD